MASENLKNIDLDRQIERYEEIRSNLSVDDKVLLAKTILLKRYTSSRYLDLFSDLLYDTASTSQEYIELLDLAASKFNWDRPHWTLFEPLIRIGREKPEVAEAIRAEMLEADADEHGRLVIVSGLLLGGMYEGNPDELLDIIEEHSGCNSPALLQADVLALRVVCRPLAAISSRIQSYIECLASLNIQSVKLEIIQFVLDNYEKNPDYFYEQLVSMVKSGNIAYAHAILFRLQIINPLHESHFFELVEAVKTYDDEQFIDYIGQRLLDYPSKTAEVADILFEWLKNRKIWSVQNVHIVIESIVKKEPSVILEFIQRYGEECRTKGYITEPVLFEYCIAGDLNAALNAVLSLPIDDRLHVEMKVCLCKKIVSHCYGKQEYSPQIRLLGAQLLGECRTKPFVACDINQRLLNTENLVENQYNELVNSISNCLESILNAKETYDFDKIFNNLEYYPTIKKYASSQLKKCEGSKVHSPLLWLLEYDICETPESYDEDPTWNLAYLSELERGLQTFEETPNSKYKTEKEKRKYIEGRLKADTPFWNIFAELIVMNRVGMDNLVAKDFSFNGNYDVDLKANLLGKTFYFEIISPETPRVAKLSNQAVFMQCKTPSKIDTKLKQVMKSGVYSEIEHSENSYCYIVINGTELPLFDVDASSAVFGPLYINYEINGETGERSEMSVGRSAEESVFLRNDNFKYISGVICFEWEVSKTLHLPPRIELKGAVFNNPSAKNGLTKPETEQLNSIFFEPPQKSRS